VLISKQEWMGVTHTWRSWWRRDRRPGARPASWTLGRDRRPVGETGVRRPRLWSEMQRVEAWGGTHRAAVTGVGRGATGLPRPMWGVEPPSCHSRREEGSHVRHDEAAVNPSFNCVSCQGEKRRKEVSEALSNFTDGSTK
jgi:hypothetical protein